jgi:hypothetical protein
MLKKMVCCFRVTSIFFALDVVHARAVLCDCQNRGEFSQEEVWHLFKHGIATDLWDTACDRSDGTVRFARYHR